MKELGGVSPTPKMNWLVLEPTSVRAVTVYVVSATSSFPHSLINPLAGLILRPAGSAGSILHTQRSWPELLARNISVGKQDTVSPIKSTSLQEDRTWKS